MATRRARNKIVTNIVARLEAEDNASPEMKKATEEGRNLATASMRVIRQFQRMDNHSAAVAKNIKGIRDASLRAKVAMQTMRGTFSGTVSTLDRLEDKITMVKIKLDNMGAAGTLIRKGLDALKFAALAAAAAIGASFLSAIRDMGEFSESAKRSNDRLEESVKRLNVAVVRAVTGIDQGGQKVGEWADSVDKLTKVINANSAELSDFVGVVTSMFPGLAALKLAYGELADSTIEYNNELTESIRLSKEHIKFTSDLAARIRQTQSMIDRQKREGFGFVPAPEDTPEEKEDAKARKRARRRRSGRRAAPAPAELVVDLSLVRAAEIEEAKRNEARVRRENAAAISAELAALQEQADALNATAERDARAILDKEELRKATEAATDANQKFAEQTGALVMDATRQAIDGVTESLGGMIEMMVAGEKSAGNFGAVFADRFGSVMMAAGKAAIVMATIAALFESGEFALPGGPGLLAAAGGAALLGGAVLKGLAKRGSKTMAGGGAAGGAAAAAQDAVNTVVNNSQRGRDEGPSETTLVVDGNPMRAWVTKTFTDAAELGEIPAVPVNAL